MVEYFIFIGTVVFIFLAFVVRWSGKLWFLAKFFFILMAIYGLTLSAIQLEILMPPKILRPSSVTINNNAPKPPGTTQQQCQKKGFVINDDGSISGGGKIECK